MVGVVDRLRVERNIFWLLFDDIKHAIFQSLLILVELVLLPDEVCYFGVHIVPLHALLEEANAVLVVRVLLKLQRSAVFHVLSELDGLVLAQLV